MLPGLLKYTEFREKYFELLKYRLSSVNLKMEDIDDDLSSPEQTLNIFQQLAALNLLLDDLDDEKKLSVFEFISLLKELICKITNGEITDFRKTNVVINGSNIKRSEPRMIRNDLMYLYNDYQYRSENCNSESERFYIEAWFHIKLLHIHPFEDGNGRTARTLLAYNLIKNGLAPCVITNQIKREYCDLIENSDYQGMANLFESLSKKETEVIEVVRKNVIGNCI